MMDFTLAQSQQAVAHLAAEVLDSTDPWKELAQAGLLDATSLGVLDTSILLNEIGRRHPSLKGHATLMTGALLVFRWGSAELQQVLLPGVASGELLLTAAIREPSNPQPDPSTTALTNGTVTGTKVGVPYAEQAALILVPAMIAGSSGRIATKTARDHGSGPKCLNVKFTHRRT
jgi:3-oxo-4-pregnene-20-carboxyl-CoA dehydrogenase alpha subunit